MSNFWASRLGVSQPAAPQQQPVSAPALVPWWANDYAQYVQPQTPQPQAQEPTAEPEPGGWGTIAGSMRKAKSAKLSDVCPECGSGNMFRPEGSPNAMLQCYECGYNPRFSQTGGQGGMPSGESGPATPARQLASAGAGGVSQFSPGTIVGRV